jgi:predicted alpha/beta hydrolase family esterase
MTYTDTPKTAIILHGLASKDQTYNGNFPSNSNCHWLPWLQKQCIVHDIKADTPEVPRTYEFNWQSWVREVERFEITPNTTLVGHSMGGGFWVRYLSEHPELNVDKVILVAPWLNLAHELRTDFFDFEVDPTIVGRTNKFVIFNSDDDDPSVQNSANFLKEKLPNIAFRTFHNYGHFCYGDMKTDAFPELLETVLES